MNTLSGNKKKTEQIDETVSLERAEKNIKLEVENLVTHSL